MTRGYTGSQTPVPIRDLWRTPKPIFDYYDKRFGFDCDVAASHDNRLCHIYIDEFSDALSCDWQTSNWCNPPYSDIAPWINKAICEMGSGNLTVMLIPADTSVKWFKLAFENCSECHFISGRLAFINEETGKPVSGNNKGSVVFVFDPNSPFKSQVCLIDRNEMMRSA
ncbi:DNA N-6-adenine-methyltransferase [Vibrio phage 120E34-1]|nr:DNA N-6-adenine-methyltransferase [Vibrio phage 120E34-1]